MSVDSQWCLTETSLPSEMTRERIDLFLLLHRFETWFRELVYVEMKARFGETWWKECEGALKRNKGGGIPADKALRGDRRHSHMATAENDPLWFISFDSLLKIVFDQRLWTLFSPFLTTKQLVRAKMLELMPVRHRIAHARALHRDDLDRVRRILADLDQGFWRFCTSYNDERPFIENHRKDPVFRHLVGRMFSGYSQLESGEWTYLASRSGTAMDTSIALILRPSAGLVPFTRSSLAGRKGILYSVTYSVAHTQARFQSDEILKATKSEHGKVGHIFLDSDELMFRVTFPALLGEVELKRLIDRFHHVCLNSRTSVARIGSAVDDAESDQRKWYWMKMQPMRLLASEWPHYVVPPDNPLKFLGPDNPCNFLVS